MNKSKKIFIITLTILMLIGLTTITATDIDNNDTTTITQTSQATIDTTTQTNTVNEDTESTIEALTTQTDNIQESKISHETLNNKNGEKTQNLKADRIVTATTYANLSNYLTSNTHDTVIINIDENIQLAGSITVNSVIKNLTINGNGKTIDGQNRYRFLTINNTNTILNNISIINCYSRTSGGAINVSYSNLTIINSLLNDNTANGTEWGSGGAISAHVTNITIITSILNNNKALGSYYSSGAAIHVDEANPSENSNIIIRNSDLNNNNAKFGGAISIYATTILTIEGSNLRYNTANVTGGAILHDYGNMSITNSNITNNMANNGGAIFTNTRTITSISYSNLNNNNATRTGGVINGYGTIIISNTNLTNNNALTGGAITVNRTSDVTITQSNLKNNNASSGGAIYVDTNSNLTITQSNITHNNASSGGAIWDYGNLSITLSTLNNNTAHDGGAIRNDRQLSIHNSTLNNNSVIWGGAINNNYGNITITNSTLNNNLAYGGGAINNDLGNITLIGNTINNNTGSAIRNNGIITIHNSTLNNNNAGAGSGGAISTNTNITITNSTLNNNIATFGGAIFTNANMTIIDSTLNNNAAGQFGGAIRSGGNLNINNATLENNTAGWGGAISTIANMTITDSTLNNNAAGSGGAIIAGLNSNNTLKNSIITNNYVNLAYSYVVDFSNAGSAIITDNTFINNTNNVRDMLFSNATEDAEVDIHGNTYIDNYLKDSIIQPNGTFVTDNEIRSYDYYIDLNLRSIYNDTVRNGTLNVYVNGVLKNTTNVTNGHARISFENNDLTKRENKITFEYVSESKHYQNISTSLILYKEVNTTLAIQAPDMMNSGQTAEINFTLKDVNNNPISGESIQVLVDGVLAANVTTDVNGVAIYTFNALGDKSVSIVATYHTTNDSFYLSAPDAVAEIDVNKIQPKIVIKHDTLIPYVETNITIHLFDDDGTPIKNKTLTVNITEEGKPDLTGTVTTDGNGIGVFNFTPIDEGILTVNVTSPEDDIYHYESVSVLISRYFITSNLLVNASTTQINKTNTIHVEVSPGDGALLSGTIELDIEGEIHTMNITNGRGTYQGYQSEIAGEKLVTVKFTSGNPSYTNATTTAQFNVEKLPTHVTIEAVNRTAGNVTLKVRVLPKEDIESIVDGGNIVIKSVNGENSKVIYNSTLKNGELIYLTDINETSWYEFETKYHGNDYFYGEENNTGSIQVLPIETNTATFDKTALVGDTITLNATVTDMEGNPVNDGNVTFLIDGSQLYRADGTPVEVKLENGIATTEYTLPTAYNAGRYIITANYQGNNKYNMSSAESELKVQSNSTVTADAVEGLVLDNITFTANVRDYHGNPVTGGYVVFKVGGKTLTYTNGTQIRTPVENGIAKLSYQAESGWIVDSHPNLKVQATYSGTSIILAGRSENSKVTIYKRNATVQVSAPDDYVNGTLHIDAVVQDQNGSLINDGVLVFKLNGLSLKDENNKGIVAKVTNGRVHVDVKLPFAYSAKKYNLTAVYSNKIYYKANGTNTTSLKAIPTYVNATVTIKDQFSKPVVTGKIYNKFNDAVLEGTAVINIKFDGISYAKKVVINNGTFRETLDGILIYKPGTHKVEVVAGANSHYDAVRKTITSKTTPKYNVNTIFTNITRNKTTTRVQAKIVDDKNNNTQKDLRITVKINGISFLVNQTVRNGKFDVLVDTSTLKNRNYTLELVSGANTYYNAGKATAELPKY